MSFPVHRQAHLWWQKRRHYERNERLSRKARVHWHFLRRDSYIRFPLNGNLLEALDEGRAEIGPWVLIERGCWFSLYPETASMAIGEGTILNLECMVAAAERVEIGAHCMFANHCFVTDADHRFDDPELPITWQGFNLRGPVTVGDNCWFGANSVVTRDLPAHTIAAGSPAKVIKEIEFKSAAG